MSKVSSLLDEGVVIQDPNNEDRVVFNVPIYIKKVAVEMGGFEAFAMQYGYTTTIKDKDGVEVINPESVHQACTKIIWDFVTDVFKASMLTQARAEAEKQAQSQIEALIK